MLKAPILKLWLGSFGVLTVFFSASAITIKKVDDFSLGLSTFISSADV
jgi:hypothetical protein